MNFFCYVLGCNSDRADVSAIHRAFGRVASCHRHHPDRGALGVGFGSLDAPAPAAPQAAPVPPGGGSRQRVLQPVAPTRPSPTRPAGGALTLPTVDPATARQRVAAARQAAVQAAAAAGGGF